LDIERLKTAVIDEIDARRASLRELALRIHDNPEPGFGETLAATWLTECLEQNGFSIERGICDLPTAFRASYGEGKSVIALIAEYDALPGVGHACGHNIICTSAVGAAIAVRSVAGELTGRIVVIGTPAEELLGGKVIMARSGAFTGLDASMIVHPGVVNTATTYALACQNLNIEFFGKAAHAAARPEEGINALEAMLLSFTAINSLRQHIKSTARIHGIITDGGKAPNVVPDYSAGKFMVRAEQDSYLDELQEKVISCFRGAADATGSRLEYRWDDVRYAPMRNNMTLAELFAGNLKHLGRQVQLVDRSGAFGSTDMGNVSQVAPAIHATIAIAPREVLLHSPEFAAAAASEEAIDGLCDAAKTMAMTVIDLLACPEKLTALKEEFEKTK
jgi:amidohydrolase